VGVWLGAPLGLWIGDRFTGQNSPSLWNFWNLSSSTSRFTLTISLMAMVVSILVIGMLERLARARADAEAAQRQAAENQLRALQSQLEPHMLFNTLANLRVLIGIDPARAQAMLDRLIAFLRATLAASRTPTHTLAEEFRFLADYLTLMGIRMGPRLQSRLSLPDELSGVAVPPLLLQPLVENAVKHGLEPKVEGGRIEVVARREGATLVLTVRDTGLGLSASGQASRGDQGGTSFGLDQIRGRLDTLHGKAASLKLENAAGAEGGTLATLVLPLAENAR
jgi:sensor histidine kinase YesM